MAKITMRDFVRVLCCLHLPADETMEASTSDMQKDNDWTKPVSAGQVILEPDAVPASRPVCSTRARRIRCGSISTTGPSPGVAVPVELVPGQSNNNQQDALAQTDFDGGLGQNSSQTSRHRTSLPSILRVGRAVVSGSVTAKRRISLWFHVEYGQTVTEKVDLEKPGEMTLKRGKMRYLSRPKVHRGPNTSHN